MAVTTIGAMIASAVIGAGASVYSSEQQKKAAKKDREARESAAEAERKRLEDIERATKPEEEGLGEIDFGAEGSDSGMGSSSDFLVPKQSGGLGSGGRSGLGFKV